MFTGVQLPVRQGWGWRRGEARIPPAAPTPLTLPYTLLYICSVHELCSRTIGEYRLCRAVARAGYRRKEEYRVVRARRVWKFTEGTEGTEGTGGSGRYVLYGQVGHMCTVCCESISLILIFFTPPPPYCSWTVVCTVRCTLRTPRPEPEFRDVPRRLKRYIFAKRYLFRGPAAQQGF